METFSRHSATLALFVSLWLGTMFVAIAEPEAFIPYVDQEQIDSTGLVWAAKHYGNCLYTYDGETWKPAANIIAPNAEFRGMTTTADGAVVVVWVVKGQGLAVTRHKGESSTFLGSEIGDSRDLPNLIRPTIDSKGVSG